MIRFTLKKGKTDSLLRRHPWVFSGAIHSADGAAEEGDVVEVYTAEGEFIARGHCGMGSIAVRVLTFEEQEPVDAAFWRNRIGAAYALRRQLGLAESGQTTCYRLVHGEGDGMPGLIIDIYEKTAVMQAHTVGIYLARNEIVEALREVFGERLESVYDKSAGTLPGKSGLEPVDGYLWGKSIAATVKENGHLFSANWEDGQKTGFFIDQRDNRALVGQYSKGKNVLNTFCYTGGFSVYALAGGARKVVSVDSSARAVELAARNVALNFGETEKHDAVATDAFAFLREIQPSDYDLIILDPPAFAKSHRALPNALQGYKRLNAAAMRKIAPGGILFTFSCSQAVSREQFRTAVFSAAAISGRKVRILHQLSQPADHPVDIYHPEGEYLKGLVLYVE